MKEAILKLRGDGKSYREIVIILGCSIGTVAYHCGQGQKEKTRRRAAKRRIKEREHSYDMYNKIKDFVWRHKRFCGCVDCGEKNPIVLEYDHSGDFLKIDRISRMIVDKINLFIIKEEIRKCVVRCANCHRIKTAKDRGWHKEQIKKYIPIV
jgi:hypothetical protein